MPITIRLRRMGRKKQAHYRIVVTDKDSPRDGRFVESLGYYKPLSHPARVVVDMERVDYWVGQGAQPSGTVSSLLKKVRKGGDASIAVGEKDPEAEKQAAQEKLAAKRRAEAEAAAAEEAQAKAPAEAPAEAAAEGEEAAPEEPAAEAEEAPEAPVEEAAEEPVAEAKEAPADESEEAEKKAE